MLKLADFVVRRARLIVAAWVVLAVVGAALGAGLGGRLLNGGYEISGSQSARATAAAAEAFPDAAEAQAYVALMRGDRGQAELARESAAVARGAATVEGVRSVGTPVPAPDGSAIVLPVALEGTIGEAQRKSEALQAWIDDQDELQDVQVVGQAAVYERYKVHGQHTLMKAALISAPIILAVLLVAFLSAAATLPLILAGASLAVTFGGLYLMTLVTPISVFAVDTALVLGLGLSVDFSLFVVMRLRQCRAEGKDMPAAITEMLDTTGRAVAISGVTVAVSLAGLFVVGIGLFSSMAAGAIVAVLLATAGGLTLAPAVLVLVGDRLDRVPPRVEAAVASSRARWGRIADFVIRRRVAIVLVTVPVLVAFSVIALSTGVSMRTLTILPDDDPVRLASADVGESFGPGLAAPIVVLARDGADAIAPVLERHPEIAAVAPPEPGDRGWTRVQAMLAVEPDSAAGEQVVRDVREALAGAAPSAVVGGPSAEAVDLADRIADRTPLVVALIALAEVLLLTILLRAPVVALKAGFTTLLTVATTLGVLSLIYGGEDLAFFVPLTLIGVVFGLSTDYEVLLLSRVREERAKGYANTESLRRGMIETGRALTLAGLTMSIVFFAFATSSLLPFTQLGLGMGLAVLLDVTVVRILLVPALIAMLGERNWWWPRRAVRHVPVRATTTKAGAR